MLVSADNSYFTSADLRLLRPAAYGMLALNGPKTALAHAKRPPVKADEVYKARAKPVKKNYVGGTPFCQGLHFGRIL